MRRTLEPFNGPRVPNPKHPNDHHCVFPREPGELQNESHFLPVASHFHPQKLTLNSSLDPCPSSLGTPTSAGTYESTWNSPLTPSSSSSKRTAQSLANQSDQNPSNPKRKLNHDSRLYFLSSTLPLGRYPQRSTSSSSSASIMEQQATPAKNIATSRRRSTTRTPRAQKQSNRPIQREHPETRKLAIELINIRNPYTAEERATWNWLHQDLPLPPSKNLQATGFDFTWPMSGHAAVKYAELNRLRAERHAAGNPCERNLSTGAIVSIPADACWIIGNDGDLISLDTPGSIPPFLENSHQPNKIDKLNVNNKFANSGVPLDTYPDMPAPCDDFALPELLSEQVEALPQARELQEQLHNRQDFGHTSFDPSAINRTYNGDLPLFHDRDNKEYLLDGDIAAALSPDVYTPTYGHSNHTNVAPQLYGELSIVNNLVDIDTHMFDPRLLEAALQQLQVLNRQGTLPTPEYVTAPTLELTSGETSETMFEVEILTPKPPSKSTGLTTYAEACQNGTLDGQDAGLDAWMAQHSTERQATQASLNKCSVFLDLYTQVVAQASTTDGAATVQKPIDLPELSVLLPGFEFINQIGADCADLPGTTSKHDENDEFGIRL